MAEARPRLLMVLPQFPQDPASGAARSTTTICEILAEGGFAIRALGTTASESFPKTDAAVHLKTLEIPFSVSRLPSKPRFRPELHYSHRNISYRLLDIGHRPMHGWQPTHGRQFDLMFDEELDQFDPDVLFTFGGMRSDVHRHQRARKRGTRLVFSLRNEGYLLPGFFDRFDAVLTPSAYLANRYRERIGLESTALPSPIDVEDVVAAEHEPIFVTMVNPSVEKGVMVLARLAEELSLRRPDIPLLVVESRGNAGTLVNAGLAGGFDLRRHQNLMASAAVPLPRDIFHPAKMLLVPSLRDTFGRVVVEAMLNGVPPIVSDRGGLADTCNGAGFVVPLPEEVSLKLNRPVAREVVEPWIDLIIRLEDDEDFYRQESQRAREASRAYLRENLVPRYLEFFSTVIRSGKVPAAS